MQHNQDQFLFRRAAFYSKLNGILAKTTARRINLDFDGVLSLSLPIRGEKSMREVRRKS